VTLSGHVLPLTCLTVCPTHGLILTGSADRTVRLWRADECIAHRLASVGAFDDPSLHALEQRVTAQRGGSKLGSGTRQMLRSFSSLLSAYIHLGPSWRVGRVTAFFDGEANVAEVAQPTAAAGVEVTFEDASVQVYANQVLLRDPHEVARAPRGPPLWSEPEATLSLGCGVAVYDVDGDVAACLCARVVGVRLQTTLDYPECAKLLGDLLDGADEADGGVRGVDIGAVLDAVGLDKDSERISVLGLIRRVYKCSEKHASRCDRVLTGNTAPIVSVSLMQASKLVVAIDQRGCVCVWDPCAHRVSLTVSDTCGRPAFVGAYPYSLVQRCQVEVGKGRGKGLLGVISAAQLQVPGVLSAAYPMTREALNRATDIDGKFAVSEVTVRGFVYVLSDLSTRAVATAAFLPSLVALDSPDCFMCAPRMVAAPGPGPAHLTPLQDI
jgi:hypothetical protein